ncbi:hypothetical protein CEXT_639781 [Caerostris extrusa]|uniref:Uncharacterized protein n=1 Tax=Caerostris extrusa TaxID=172846 RepID=A0AAV4M3R5_CAEEX|nr:hypothetical protein CEXT_639781 [Caerostris extrusa]
MLAKCRCRLVGIDCSTWKTECNESTAFTECNIILAIGPEISLRILVGVAKPAGGIKVRIELFISFHSSTQLQILVHFLNNLVVSCWFLGEMSEHHRLDEGMSALMLSTYQSNTFFLSRLVSFARRTCSCVGHDTVVTSRHDSVHEFLTEYKNRKSDIVMECMFK